MYTRVYALFVQKKGHRWVGLEGESGGGLLKG